jgi:hypothetical protein
MRSRYYNLWGIKSMNKKHLGSGFWVLGSEFQFKGFLTSNFVFSTSKFHQPFFAKATKGW